MYMLLVERSVWFVSFADDSTSSEEDGEIFN